MKGAMSHCVCTCITSDSLSHFSAHRNRGGSMRVSRPSSASTSRSSSRDNLALPSPVRAMSVSKPSTSDSPRNSISYNTYSYGQRMGRPPLPPDLLNLQRSEQWLGDCKSTMVLCFVGQGSWFCVYRYITL